MQRLDFEFLEAYNTLPARGRKRWPDQSRVVVGIGTAKMAVSESCNSIRWCESRFEVEMFWVCPAIPSVPILSNLSLVQQEEILKGQGTISDSGLLLPAFNSVAISLHEFLISYSDIQS